MYKNGSMVHILHAGANCMIFPFVVCTHVSVPVDTQAQGLEVDEGLVAELAGEKIVIYTLSGYIYPHGCTSCLQQLQMLIFVSEPVSWTAS